MLSKPKVAEVYGPVIQGEGPVIGRPTIFVRLGGCDFRCAWCDTDHAVLPKYRDTWTPTAPDDLVAQVKELAPPPMLITFSGGNPAIQPLGAVIEGLHAAGYETAIETQGTVGPSWLHKVGVCVVSPKPPSAKQGFEPRLFEQFMEMTGDTTACKIVCADLDDLRWALSVWEDFGHLFSDPRLYLQPMNRQFAPGVAIDRDDMLASYKALADAAIKLNLAHVVVLPQLHALAWGGGPGV